MSTYAPTYYVRVDNQSLPEELAQRILSVEIDEEDGKLPKVTVSLQNQDLALIDDDRLTTGKRFSVRWGYLGSLNWGEVSGSVKKVKGFLTRDVVAYGEALAMASQTETRVWSNVRYSDIAREIAARWGLTPIVAETSAVHEQVAQSNESDFKFLQRLAQKVGYTVESDGEILRFGPKDFGAAPVLALVYRGRDGSILTFDPVEEEVGEPGEVRVVAMDPQEKRVIVAQADNESTEREAAGPVYFSAETGAEVAVSPVDPEVKRQIASVVATVEEAKEQADAEFRKAEESIIKAKAKVIGDPRLRAGKIITIRGVGRRYSGNWRIKKAVHRLGAGYLVELELERNATPAVAGKEETQAMVNSKAAQVSSDIREIVYSGETGRVVG